MSFLQDQVKQARIGDDAGWALQFFQRIGNALNPEGYVIDSSRYYAKIEATLVSVDTTGSGSFEGGTFKFTIQNLTDEDYQMIWPAVEDLRPGAIGLSLFWRDANSDFGAMLRNAIGFPQGLDGSIQDALVAILAPTKVKRVAATNTYDVEIEAVEYISARLRRQLTQSLEAENFAQALQLVTERAQLSSPIQLHGANPPAPDLTSPTDAANGLQRVSFSPGMTYGAVVKRIARAVEIATGRLGRSTLLIRDGKLHVGVRPVPLEGEPKRLDLDSGLLLVEEETQGDEGADKRFKLTCKGRADIKPGDVLTFPWSPDDFAKIVPDFATAALGSFLAPVVPDLTSAGAMVQLYVESVKHTLSRTAGFTSLITGVKLTGTYAPYPAGVGWAYDAPPASTATEGAGSRPSTGDAAADAAARIRRLTQRTLETLKTLEVAEVRSVTVNASGRVEPPSQTETVYEGVQRTDPFGNGTRRSQIQRDPATRLSHLAYATPFAWGLCGLVLPRYPGTRVVLGYRNGNGNDPVDLGSVWESGTGPRSQPGDYWLSLPVDVPANRRESVPDSTSAPQFHDGKVTQDLIDAEGKRIIEVGEITIRAGKQQLQSAGQRPNPPGEADCITIEHRKEGSKIVMKPNGDIEIVCKNFKIDAQTKITLKAPNVDVEVTGAMEVK
jgi:hypothetical protein